MPAFSKPIFFPRIAQVGRVVDVDAGDDGDVGLDDVDRIQASAQADFEDGDVDAALRDQVGDGQGGEFEIRQVGAGAGGFDGVEGVHERLIGCHLAIDAGALVEVEEVRLDVEADAVAGLQQHRFEHRAGGTLAIGAGDHDHRAIEGQLQALLDGADAVQAHVDMGFGMARLEQGQPIGQGGGKWGHGGYDRCARLPWVGAQAERATEVALVSIRPGLRSPGFAAGPAGARFLRASCGGRRSCRRRPW